MFGEYKIPGKPERIARIREMLNKIYGIDPENKSFNHFISTILIKLKDQMDSTFEEIISAIEGNEIKLKSGSKETLAEGVRNIIKKIRKQIQI